jgi:two-component system, chemotaxis family, sensor kinase CheA
VHILKKILKNKSFYLILIISIFIPNFINGITSYAAGNAIDSDKVINIQQNWKYYLGDFSYKPTDKDLWLSNFKAGDWKGFNVPGQPPGATESKYIWLSVKLPENSFKDPHIHLITYGQEVEVFINDNLIYQYGDFNKNSTKIRPGTPLLLILLPDDYHGKTLFFRLHGINSNDMGRINRLELGSKADIYLMIFNKDILRFVLSFIILFVAILALFLFFINRLVHMAFLSLAISSLIIFIWIFSLTTFKFFVSGNLLFWYYTNYIANYMIPVGFLLFAQQLFEKGRSKTLLGIMWKFQIAFTIVVLLLDVFGISTFNIFMQLDFIFAFVYAVSIIMTLSRDRNTNVVEVRLFLIGFCIMLIFTLNDILYIYYKLLELGADTLHFGYFAFIVFMILTLGVRLVNTYGKLKIYSNDIDLKNKSLNEMWKELSFSQDRLAILNENLEDTVIKQTADIRRILNNAGQGFLTFGKDLIVQDNYSIECINIFGYNIEGMRFSNLILSDDEGKKYLELMLVKIFNESSEYKKEIYIQLLPSEIQINNNFISISYKVIDDNPAKNNKIFMVILTDISEKRFLENTMEKERIILKMIVKAVTSYNDFIRFVRDYERFCEIKIFELLNSNQTVYNISFEIFRAVHTFKGNFSQMDMVNIVDGLHMFETELSEICKKSNEITIDDLKNFISEHDIIQWLKKDMDILNEVLGEDYFKHEKALTIDQTKLILIENKLSGALTPEQQKDILIQIRNLRYKPIFDLLKIYQNFIAKFSTHLEKPMKPIQFIGKDIQVDIEKYQDFTVSLINVFRNIMDHGIESPDERAKAGKALEGNIKCSARIYKGNLLLSISDDGRGLDLSLIKKKAVEKGIYSEVEIKSINSEKILNIIFMDGFSTKSSISRLSGRGMGLSAVKAELNKLGGSVVVKNCPGKGMRFCFRLPLAT